MENRGNTQQNLYPFPRRHGGLRIRIPARPQHDQVPFIYYQAPLVPDPLVRSSYNPLNDSYYLGQQTSGMYQQYGEFPPSFPQYGASQQYGRAPQYGAPQQNGAIPQHGTAQQPGGAQQHGAAQPLYGFHQGYPQPPQFPRTPSNTTPTTSGNDMLGLTGTRFTSGGVTYDILESLDPRAMDGTDSVMSKGIYKLRQVDNGKLYAFKRLAIDQPGRARVETNVLQQIRKAGKPRHLNIMKQFVWDCSTMEASLVLELCDLGNIDQAIQKHRAAMTKFDEKHLWVYFASIAKALAFLHEGIDTDHPEVVHKNWNAIAHLDIKPTNIFLSSLGQRDGVPRLVLGDFGCAATREDVEANRCSKWRIGYGTDGWYPPEAMNTESPRYGKPTDIWQLGGVMQVMSLLSTAPSLTQLARGNPCSMAFSTYLNDGVSACMHTDPAKRPQILNVMTFLEQFVENFKDV